jgi:hypothetical protein
LGRIITRRDGENLVLLRESEVEAGRVGVALAAQIVGAAVTDSPAADAFVQRLQVPLVGIPARRPASRLR